MFDVDELIQRVLSIYLKAPLSYLINFLFRQLNFVSCVCIFFLTFIFFSNFIHYSSVVDKVSFISILRIHLNNFFSSVLFLY